MTVLNYFENIWKQLYKNGFFQPLGSRKYISDDTSVMILTCNLDQ